MMRARLFGVFGTVVLISMSIPAWADDKDEIPAAPKRGDEIIQESIAVGIEAGGRNNANGSANLRYQRATLRAESVELNRAGGEFSEIHLRGSLGRAAIDHDPGVHASTDVNIRLGFTGDASSGAAAYVQGRLGYRGEFNSTKDGKSPYSGVEDVDQNRHPQQWIYGAESHAGVEAGARFEGSNLDALVGVVADVRYGYARERHYAYAPVVNNVSEPFETASAESRTDFAVQAGLRARLYSGKYAYADVSATTTVLGENEGGRSTELKAEGRYRFGKHLEVGAQITDKRITDISDKGVWGDRDSVHSLEASGGIFVAW